MTPTRKSQRRRWRSGMSRVGLSVGQSWSFQPGSRPRIRRTPAPTSRPPRRTQPGQQIATWPGHWPTGTAPRMCGSPASRLRRLVASLGCRAGGRASFTPRRTSTNRSSHSTPIFSGCRRSNFCPVAARTIQTRGYQQRYTGGRRGKARAALVCPRASMTCRPRRCTL
uniref:Uncharacterized protein n=1 Tax=uncultured marine virus TaxID=186617 RepID=A0A0F7L4Y7_9VIRU|nr:hypothetical protein [uncultured marine virus]